MTSAALANRIWSLPDLLNVEWADGTSSEFASLWLRDNLRDDRDPHSGQRLVDIPDLPENPRIRSAVAHNGAVNIEWEAEPRPATFELEWLRAHASNRSLRPPEFAPKRWLDGSTLDAAKDFAWATFHAAQSDRALRAAWTARLLQDGIAFLREVPSVDAGILEAAALMGRVSETNYGQVFDVRSVPQPENLAYSDLGLGLHTDNPYREPVPGFQVLHALIGLLARRRRESVRRRLRHRRAFAQYLSRCLRDPDPNPRSLLVSLQGCRALRGKAIDSAHLFRRGERRALQQPLDRAAAARGPRCAALLHGLSALRRPAARLALSFAATYARRRSRGLR